MRCLLKPILTIVVLATGLFVAPVAGAAGMSSAQLQLQAVHNTERFAVLSQAAPRADGDHCATGTVDVPGQGASCYNAAVRDWIVPTAVGPAAITHGPDFQTAADGSGADQTLESRLSPGDAAAVNAANTMSVVCTTNDRQPHYLAIYAHASDVSAQTAIPAQLATSLEQASAFVNAQDQDAGGAGARLRFTCDGSGAPYVDEVELPTPSASATFATIVSDLQAAGYGTASDSTERYIVYYDGDAINNVDAGGQAEISNSSAPGAASVNNAGGTFALQYSDGSYTPSWPTLLHEIGHTMGAVQDDAPHTTGAAHCTDGPDIMCYIDGGPNSASYSFHVCTYLAFDCNNDDYFAPTPAPGSYLTTHWNIAASYNRFLHFTDGDLDLTPPLQPAAPTISSITGHSAAISYAIPVDDVATTQVRILTKTDLQSTYAPTATIDAPVHNYTFAAAPATTYSVELQALDAAGNTSLIGPATTFTTGPDDIAPTAPTNLSVSDVTDTSLQLSWTAATDNIAVRSYTVEQLVAGSWSPLPTGPIWPNTIWILDGLTDSTSYTLRVRAADAAGNSAVSTEVTATTQQTPTAPDDPGAGGSTSWGSTGDGEVALPPVTILPAPASAPVPAATIIQPAPEAVDTVKPTAPARPQVTADRKGIATIAWKRSTDASGIKTYRVTYTIAGTRHTIAVKTPRARIRVKSGQRVRVTITAIDNAGNTRQTTLTLTGR